MLKGGRAFWVGVRPSVAANPGTVQEGCVMHMLGLKRVSYVVHPGPEFMLLRCLDLVV